MRVPAHALAALTLALAAPLAASAQEADLEGIAYDIGDPDAPVVVVEYADFACGACGQFARDTWPDVKREFIDTGRVFWRFVPFELGFRNSDESVRMGHCGARLGDFWALHDALYESQSEWIDERRPKDLLIGVAVRLGHDEEAARACYDDDPGKDRTKDANRAARKDGVRATPTFFVNGFQMQGALPLELWVELIQRVERKR